jgi:hypothetical protein
LLAEGDQEPEDQCDCLEGRRAALPGERSELMAHLDRLSASNRQLLDDLTELRVLRKRGAHRRPVADAPRAPDTPAEGVGVCRRGAAEYEMRTGQIGRPERPAEPVLNRLVRAWHASLAALWRRASEEERQAFRGEIQGRRGLKRSRPCPPSATPLSRTISRSYSSSAVSGDSGVNSWHGTFWMSPRALATAQRVTPARMRSSAVTSSGWRSSKPRAFMFTWASFVLSSVPFGLLHGRHGLPGVLAGMLFALAVYRRGRTADPVVARVTANTLVAVTVLLTGNWGLWA